MKRLVVMVKIGSEQQLIDSMHRYSCAELVVQILAPGVSAQGKATSRALLRFSDYEQYCDYAARLELPELTLAQYCSG
jgi:hypothetical protein